MKRVSKSLGRGWRGGWREMIEIEALTQKNTRRRRDTEEG